MSQLVWRRRMSTERNRERREEKNETCWQKNGFLPPLLLFLSASFSLGFDDYFPFCYFSTLPQISTIDVRMKEISLQERYPHAFVERRRERRGRERKTAIYHSKSSMRIRSHSSSIEYHRQERIFNQISNVVTRDRLRHWCFPLHSSIAGPVCHHAPSFFLVRSVLVHFSFPL